MKPFPEEMRARADEYALHPTKALSELGERERYGRVTARSAYEAGAHAALSSELVQNVRKTSEQLGGWMSAALDCHTTCEEMKIDIMNWFKALNALDEALKERKG